MSTQAEAYQYRINELEQKTVELRDKWLRAVAAEHKVSEKLEAVNVKLAKITATLRE